MVDGRTGRNFAMTSVGEQAACVAESKKGHGASGEEDYASQRSNTLQFWVQATSRARDVEIRTKEL